MDDDMDISEVKKGINNLLFMHLPGDTTIEDLEILALEMLGCIYRHKENTIQIGEST